MAKVEAQVECPVSHLHREVLAPRVEMEGAEWVTHLEITSQTK